MKKGYLILTFLAVSLVSCSSKDDYASVPQKVEGYRPVYADTSQDIKELVYIGDTVPVESTGREYLYLHFKMREEKGRGLHVYDNSNQAKPIRFAFIHIPFSKYMDVSDSFINAETYIGKLKISIAPLPQIRILSFTRYTSNKGQGMPPLPAKYSSGSSFYGRSDKIYYFECIDFNRGLVAGWEKTEIRNPKCYVVR